MGPQRYERVSNNDEDGDNYSPVERSSIPASPPPSFHSRESSPAARRLLSYDPARSDEEQTLADTFDVDASDDEEENDGDHRQRLMRGTSSSAADDQPSPSQPTAADARPGMERRTTRFPFFGRANTAGRAYGGGSGSDGVFANLSAKPEVGEKLEEQPPTYEQAAADAAPPYWETTILAPGLGGPDEVYVQGLPVGSVFSFVWNAMISMSFQLVGFLLTYLLHTTHAAKNGSRAGLGITLVQYGFYMKGTTEPNAPPTSGDAYTSPPDPNSHDFNPDKVAAATEGGDSGGLGSMASGDWMAYILMIVGWFILIRAVTDYLRARRHERLVLQSPDRGLPIPIIASGEEAATVV